MNQLIWLLLGQGLVTVLMTLFWFFPRVDVDCPYQCPTRIRRGNRWTRLVRLLKRRLSKQEPEEFPF
jgi:hypothetical protein